MGLDNIPHIYPCVAAGSAVMTTEDKIDCDATVAAGGCPWQRAVTASDLGTPIYGMLGTYCWYRGKAGEFVRREVETLVGEDAPGDFYGEESDTLGEANLSADACRALSDWLFGHAEAYAAHLLVTRPEDAERDFDEYRYAVWWLRFVAEYAEGADAWY